LANKQKRIEEIEANMEAPGFWDETDKSQDMMKELKGLKVSFEKYDELKQGLEDARTLIEMADEENDASLIPEIQNEITIFQEKIDKLKISTLLSEEYDQNNACRCWWNRVMRLGLNAYAYVYEMGRFKRF